MERITSRRNPICVHMKRLGESRGYRQEHGQFLCDGIKLLEEAVQSGVEVMAVLTASEIPYPLLVETRVYHCDRNIVDSVSPLKSSTGPVFTCSMPRERNPITSEGTHILLDSLQDPGNIGAIIRTADAFGIKSVIMSKMCADAYNPKAIRASMGAIFRQEIHVMELAELEKLKYIGFRIIGAEAGEIQRDISGVPLQNSIVAIGNEGNGLSMDVRSLCDEMVTIPISHKCESLNAAVAAAIVMWEAAKQNK